MVSWVSRFGIESQAVTSVWVRLPQVTKLRTHPNMTLAVVLDVKPPTLTFTFFYLMLQQIFIMIEKYFEIYLSSIFSVKMWNEMGYILLQMWCPCTTLKRYVTRTLEFWSTLSWINRVKYLEILLNSLLVTVFFRCCDYTVTYFIFVHVLWTIRSISPLNWLSLRIEVTFPFQSNQFALFLDLQRFIGWHTHYPHLKLWVQFSAWT